MWWVVFCRDFVYLFVGCWWGFFWLVFLYLQMFQRRYFFHLSTSGNKITGHFPMSNDFLN